MHSITSCISETRAVQGPRADTRRAAAPEKQGTGGKVGKDEGPAQMIPIHTESLQPGGGVAPRVEVPPSPALWGVAPRVEVPPSPALWGVAPRLEVPPSPALWGVAPRLDHDVLCI